MSACTRPPPLARTAQDGLALTTAAHTEGIDLFLLGDDSRSIDGEGGTEPSGLPYEAAKYPVPNLPVTKADATSPQRLALIHFGDAAVARLLVDPIPANAEELARRMPHVGKYLGNTRFIEALREVKEVADAAPAYANGGKPNLAIFTAGEPHERRRLPTPGGAAEDALFDRLADFHLDALLARGSRHLAIDVDASTAARYTLVERCSAECRGFGAATAVPWAGRQPPRALQKGSAGRCIALRRGREAGLGGGIEAMVYEARMRMPWPGGAWWATRATMACAAATAALPCSSV
jgi:hypothetical protein